MKIYIAAPYQLRSTAISMMGILEVHGFVVTSSWLKNDEDPLDLTAQSSYAAGSLKDVAAADALLALNPVGWERSGTGGRHVELGYALALGKRVVLVGVNSNVFHHLDAVEVTQTLEEAVEWLKR